MSDEKYKVKYEIEAKSVGHAFGKGVIELFFTHENDAEECGRALQNARGKTNQKLIVFKTERVKHKLSGLI